MIAGDAESEGEPTVSNGLSLCSIHHHAFDRDLVGVSPDLEVRVAPRLLEEIDGPMLDVLKGFEGATIDVPRRSEWRPDRNALAIRFDRFTAAA
jgi:putative restriction endonuclease